MAGFDALYRQTVTFFNRIKDDEGNEYFIPTVLTGVHLIMDQSAVWNNYGGQQSDNIRLHVRYQIVNGKSIVESKKYIEPKEWKRLESYDGMITFRYSNGNDFDFFIKDAFKADKDSLADEITIDGKKVSCKSGMINDSYYSRHGFYNYLNKTYDHVFAVTAVSQYNVIPHFEIMAR